MSAERRTTSNVNVQTRRRTPRTSELDDDVSAPIDRGCVGEDARRQGAQSWGGEGSVLA